MGPSGTGALQRSRKSAAGCLTAVSSSRTCGFACAYVWISVRISSLDLPLRPVKKAFTSGWLNRYDDVPALTPEMQPARPTGGQSSATWTDTPSTAGPAGTAGTYRRQDHIDPPAVVAIPWVGAIRGIG